MRAGGGQVGGWGLDRGRGRESGNSSMLEGGWGVCGSRCARRQWREGRRLEMSERVCEAWPRVLS